MVTAVILERHPYLFFRKTLDMSFTMSAAKRKSGNADELRADRQIPAVLYGQEITATPVAVDYRAFEQLYAKAGESNLIDFTVDSASPVKVLVQDVQFDPVKGRIVHVDFRQINMNKEMEATIPLHFKGEPAAVKELGGTLITALESVRVKCLPKDLVSFIEVDLTVLKSFDDSIHVENLAIPAGMTILDATDAVLAKVAAPLTEEQLKAMEETTTPVDLSKIEVEEKGKKEEEGDAAAEAGDKKEEKK